MICNYVKDSGYFFGQYNKVIEEWIFSLEGQRFFSVIDFLRFPLTAPIFYHQKIGPSRIKIKIVHHMKSVYKYLLFINAESIVFLISTEKYFPCGQVKAELICNDLGRCFQVRLTKQLSEVWPGPLQTFYTESFGTQANG